MPLNAVKNLIMISIIGIMIIGCDAEFPLLFDAHTNESQTNSPAPNDSRQAISPTNTITVDSYPSSQMENVAEGEKFLPFVEYVPIPTHYVTQTPTLTPTLNASGAVDYSWSLFSSETSDLPEPSGATQQTASLVLDIDLDGKDDFVIGTRFGSGPALVWYQLSETGWKRYVIEPDLIPIEAGGTIADIDGDGDLDLIFGGDATSSYVWWWENPYPFYDANQRWNRYAIKSSGGKKHHDQAIGDVDGDGNPEVVFWNQGAKKLFVADVPANPKTSPWVYTEIYSWSSGEEHEGLAIIDIDQDGILDIVGGGRWFKYKGGSTYDIEVVDDTMRFTRVVAGQIIPGGHPEIVFAPGDKVGYLRLYHWENNSWNGKNIFPSEYDHLHTLQLIDINHDGGLDLFIAEMRLNDTNPDSIFGFQLGNGNGDFQFVPIASGYGNHESRLGDFDGNGVIDILGKPYNWQTPRVDVWLGKLNGRTLDSWQRIVIDENKPARSLFVGAADLNGDNFNDVITGGWWYLNPGNPNLTWNRRTIGSPLNNYAIHFDIDRDGDIDLFGTQGIGNVENSSFAWAENIGDENLFVRTNIQGGDGDFLQGILYDQFAPSEIDLVMSWHVEGKGLQSLLIPVDPRSSTWTFRKISSISQDEAISSGDIDLDGLPDLLLGTKWLKNMGGSFAERVLFDTTEVPDRNRLVDINKDGKLDALIGYETVNTPGKLAWYEQPVNNNGFWIEHIIDFPIGPMSLDAQDMDGDLDIDIVVGEHVTNQPQTASLFVYENLDGLGLNWRKHTVYTGDEHHDGAQIVDIDGDGDQDIISIGWTHNRVLLYQNLAMDTERLRILSTANLPNNSMESESNLRPNEMATPTKTPQPVPLAPTSVPITPTTSQIDSANIKLLIHYSFDEAEGYEVFDRSNYGNPLNLMFSDFESIKWIPGGIKIMGSSILKSKTPPEKLTDWVRNENEISVSIWLKPDDLSLTGPARIVSISKDPYYRNFTISQDADIYDIRLRTTDRSENGRPSIRSEENTVKEEISLLVFTRDQAGIAKIFINGRLVTETELSGSMNNWDDAFHLLIGNELTMDRPWRGEIYDLKIFGVALKPGEIEEIFKENGY